MAHVSLYLNIRQRVHINGDSDNLHIITCLFTLLISFSYSNKMPEVECVLGYEFINTELRDEALLAAGASVSDPTVDGDPRGNKRLAMVGDAVLQLVILDRWYGDNTDPGRQSLIFSIHSLANHTRSGRKQTTQTKRFERCTPSSGVQGTLANDDTLEPVPKGGGTPRDTCFNG